MEKKINVSQTDSEQSKWNGSIKTKIIGTVIPLISLMVIIMIVMSYSISSKILHRNATALLDSSISYQSASIAAWLDENLAAFSTVKQAIEKTHPDNAALQELLDSYKDYNSNFPNGLYVADQAGNVIKATESEQQFSDVTNATWFKEGLSRVNMAYGSAHQNADGANIVSASALINDGSDQIRVVSADVSLQRITVIVNSFVQMGDAESFLVDSSDGTILAHRNSDLISTKLDTSNKDKFLAAVAKKIENQEFDDCEIQGNLTGFDTIAGTDWVLVSYVDDDIIYSDVKGLRTNMIIIALICLVLLAIAVERITHMVVKPVRNLTGTITAMSEGDFSVDVDVKGKDEIARMGHSVAVFLESMRGMLREIQDISAQVSGQSETTNDLSVSMNDVANIQTESMNELNVTVEQLAVAIGEIAENATTLATVVSDTKETSDEVEHCMEMTVSASERGKKDMRQVNSAMMNISESIEQLHESINKVGKASDEITNIVAVIGNIADETNLLSLNASIEAARAGDAGRGFAVVATEIGKLAQTSSESVGNIVNLIEEVTRLVQETVEQADHSMQSIQESSGMIGTALTTFDEIFNDIHRTEELLDQMMNKVGEVDEIATNVAAISEQQAASTEEIQTTSENMVTQASNISNSSNAVMDGAKDLSESAENLKERIERFKI